MKKVKMNIDGQIIEAIRFTTRTAAEKYISRKEGRKMLFFVAHKYFVSA